MQRSLRAEIAESGIVGAPQALSRLRETDGCALPGLLDAIGKVQAHQAKEVLALYSAVGRFPNGYAQICKLRLIRRLSVQQKSEAHACAEIPKILARVSGNISTYEPWGLIFTYRLTEHYDCPPGAIVTTSTQAEWLEADFVCPDSAAERAGMRGGDLVSYVNNVPVKDGALTVLVASRNVELLLLRDGKPIIMRMSR